MHDEKQLPFKKRKKDTYLFRFTFAFFMRIFYAHEKMLIETV